MSLLEDVSATYANIMRETDLRPRTGPYVRVWGAVE